MHVIDRGYYDEKGIFYNKYEIRQMMYDWCTRHLPSMTTLNNWAYFRLQKVKENDKAFVSPDGIAYYQAKVYTIVKRSMQNDFKYVLKDLILKTGIPLFRDENEQELNFDLTVSLAISSIEMYLNSHLPIVDNYAAFYDVIPNQATNDISIYVTEPVSSSKEKEEAKDAEMDA